MVAVVLFVRVRQLLLNYWYFCPPKLCASLSQKVQGELGLGSHRQKYPCYRPGADGQRNNCGTTTASVSSVSVGL